MRDFAVSSHFPDQEPGTAKHIWDFIKTYLEANNLADYADPLEQTLLLEGGLVLFDGLDEVPEAERRRSRLKQAIESFAATYGRCRILVTSRTYAYQDQDWRLDHFEVAELDHFSPGQIRRFIDRWYDFTHRERGPKG